LSTGVFHSKVCIGGDDHEGYHKNGEHTTHF
jgi:hypothetical protein